MRRSTIHGFLMIGAIAAGQWVEKNTAFSGLIVIIAALVIIVPLSFMGYMGPRYRRRKWRPRSNGWQRQPYDRRSRSNGWQQPKDRQFPAWAVYALTAFLMVATSCTIFFWPSSQPSEAAALSSSGQFQCDVSSITDGDTLRCSDGTRIRLHAVAARESDETCKSGHPCPSASAASATAMLSQLASGQTLQCEQTGTSYGRVTAVCWNQQNTEINCAMVNSGTTVVWPKFNNQRSICN